VEGGNLRHTKIAALSWPPRTAAGVGAGVPRLGCYASREPAFGRASRPWGTCSGLLSVFGSVPFSSPRSGGFLPGHGVYFTTKSLHEGGVGTLVAR
jgi:hypothetical protein